MSLLIALGVAAAVLQTVASPTAAVSGQVLSVGTSTPIAGAEVLLVPMHPGPAQSSIQPRNAVTDRDGRYAFEDIEAGQYRITVQKPGFASPSHSDLPQVTLTPAERRQDVNVRLERGSVIAGRVLDETGEPAVDVRVAAIPSAALPTNARPLGLEALALGGQGQTNDLGEFRLFGLRAGDYIVQAMPRPDFGVVAAGRPTTILPTYFPGTADATAAATIRVDVGQTAGEITIRMVAVPAFQVSGVVLDEARRPVSNAMVRVMATERTAEPALAMRMANQARTDTSGRFSINNLPGGSYVLVATAPLVLGGSPKPAVGGGATAGGFASFGATSGFAGGIVGGGVITEMSGGTMIQYFDDLRTEVPIEIDQTSVTGLEVVVRVPAR